jgi:hypothetical protein
MFSLCLNIRVLNKTFAQNPECMKIGFFDHLAESGQLGPSVSLVNPLALCITIDMFCYGRDSKC